MNSMEALPMTKAEVRRTYTKADGSSYDKVVVGAIIAKCEAKEPTKILLLQRAAHEIFYPNVFEIPGGNVDESDQTVADAVRREVIEETGMQVVDIIGAVNPFTYSLEKKVLTPDGEESSVMKTTLQLNYTCNVAKHDLTLNPEEHSQGKFVDRSEMVGLEVTEQMRAVVEDGFRWMEQKVGMSRAIMSV